MSRRSTSEKRESPMRSPASSIPKKNSIADNMLSVINEKPSEKA